MDPNSHIAVKFSAPWWYCHDGIVILTGEYGKNVPFGIIWEGPFSYFSFFKEAVMMVRPN